MEVLNRTVRRIVSGGLVRQKTLKSDVECDGVALHSGLPVNMRIRPALPETGIVFRRVDVEAKKQEILARYDNVVDTRLCTKIANEHGVSVSTIEHLMAALAGCEIDNAIIELNAEEVPVMDGSSAPFVKLIEEVGVVEMELGGANAVLARRRRRPAERVAPAQQHVQQHARRQTSVAAV